MSQEPLDTGRVDDLLTTREVARLLRVTPETVRRLGRSGRLRGFVWSDRGGWRFRRGDVEAFTSATEWRP